MIGTQTYVYATPVLHPTSSLNPTSWAHRVVSELGNPRPAMRIVEVDDRVVLLQGKDGRASVRQSYGGLVELVEGDLGQKNAADGSFVRGGPDLARWFIAPHVVAI